MTLNDSSASHVSLDPMAELAGLAEVAAICGVSKRTASSYAKRGDFPEPIDRLASGPVWRRAEVAEWARVHLPLPPGRPTAPERGGK
jgi:predicted DNA-binding transcriptional regulator AlpA